MRLIIAGGGTGGHLFPALAVARAVRREVPDAEVLFVGTQHGIEARIIPGTEFPIRFITARGLRKTGLVNTLRGMVELPAAVLQSISIIREFRPGVVLGVGGYASGPTLAAAAFLRYPTAIQEQNSVMGTTNRILARIVDRIFISWQATVPATSPAKTVLPGNPIREDLLAAADPREPDGQVHLLIFGGSRGARSINQAIIGNLGQLTPLAGKLRVLHQTGPEAADAVRTAYGETGIEADVREFIDEMGEAYRWADLVVCRSGASSLAELTALGKPAIVIPYPYAIGDHQVRNAAMLQARGAVRVIRDDRLKNGALVKEIVQVVENPDILAAIAHNAREFGRPDAAFTIARELLRLERSHA